MSETKYTTLPYQPSFYMNLKQGSDEWKERRKDFPVTGSQIASVFNLSAYNGSAKKLYQNKKNNTEEKFSRFQTEVIFGHGTRSEPIAAARFWRWFQQEFPDKSQWTVAESGISTYKSRGKGYFFGASPDRIIVDEEGQIQGIIEIKCPYKKVLHWNGFNNYLSFLKKHGSTPTTITETCNIRVYNEYYLQMQMQMQSTGVKYGYFVGWTPYEMVIVKIPFSEELWKDTEQKLEEFVEALNEGDTGKLIAKEETAKFEQRIKKLQDEKNVLVYYTTTSNS